MSTEHRMERLFNPKTMAVVGISLKGKDPASGWAAGGGQYIREYQRLGYEGHIYPIHLTATDDILGLKPYKSLLDVPEPIDFCVICVPPKAVPDVLEDCAKAGVKFAHIFSAGFSETGEPEGIELEKRVVEIAKRGNIGVIGPNCNGLAYVPSAKISMWPILPPRSGPVAYLSQSGVNCFQFITYGLGQGLLFSKVVSYGNAAVLDATDYLDYYAQDPETKVICAYIEGVKDGKRFTQLVKETNKKKPVVIWKGGVTSVGARAASSHTGALAGNEEVWDAFFKQTGAIRVSSLEELADVAMTLLYLRPRPRGNRVGVMLGGGGYSVQTADLCTKEGLELPIFSEETQKELKSFIAVTGAGFKNPLDSEPMAEHSEQIFGAIKTLSADPSIDTIIMSTELGFLRGAEKVKELTENLTQFAQDNPYKKPVAAIMDSAMARGDEMKEAVSALKKALPRAAVPLYRTMARLVRAVAKVTEYYRFCAEAKEE
jgi:acyl-CoA synthetase (NDP forming)